MQQLFWGAAVGGTLFFAFRVIMMIIGGIDSGHTPDLDSPDDIHTDLQDSAGAFKLLSLNSLSGCIAMFGWSGLAASLQFSCNIPMSLLIAALCGFAVMILTSFIYYGASKLKSDGEQFNIEQTAGIIADVYIRIPAQGTGRIFCTVNKIKHELDAISDTGEEIPSFVKVLIIRAYDSRTVTVIPFEEGV
ncbi:hypothetical protein FACS1894164_08550 [Spirochaetia bacterium]|nr:hypothetical protein FACS1894164_08550 [Spirochaetia bacterium]